MIFLIYRKEKIYIYVVYWRNIQYKETRLFFRFLWLLFFSFLSIFSKLSTERNIFRVNVFLRNTVDAISVSPVPSSGHPVARRQEAKRKNLPLLPSHRVRHNFSPIVRSSFLPPPSRRYPPSPAVPSLSSDFPHSIFAISTSDIENSQSGSVAWSYSQWHYSVLLPHQPLALFSFSPLSGFPRLPAVELSLSTGFRARMRGLTWAQSGSIRRFARWGITTRRARLGVLFCMRARVARLLRFDSTSGRTNAGTRSVSILLCPNARCLHWDFPANVTRW